MLPKKSEKVVTGHLMIITGCSMQLMLVDNEQDIMLTFRSLVRLSYCCVTKIIL